MAVRDFDYSDEEDKKMFDDFSGRFPSPILLEVNSIEGSVHIKYETKTYTIQITQVDE